MRRLLIAVLILLAPCLSFAGTAQIRAMMGMWGAGAGTATPVYTDCSNIGTADFYWNGDHASGDMYGCYSGGTKNATNATTTYPDSATDPGVSSPDSSLQVAKYNVNGAGLYWAVSSEDIADPTEGSVEMDVYLEASTGNNALFEIRGASTAANDLVAYVTSTGAVRVDCLANGVTVTVSSTDLVPDTAWTRVKVRWSVANNTVSVKVGNGNWKDDTSGNTVNDFSIAATQLGVGRGTVTNNVYVDNFKVYKSYTGAE